VEHQQHQRTDFVKLSKDGGHADLNGSEIIKQNQPKKNLMLLGG